MKAKCWIRGGLVALLVALSGCALSPQQVVVQPVLPLEGEAWGQGTPLTVIGEDQRASAVLGSRGGVYGESATLTISNDLGKAIQRAATGYLATQGFQVNHADSSAAILRIVVEELRYETPDEKIGRETKIVAVLRAEAQRGGESITGRYQSTAEYRSVTRPDANDNSQWLNKILTDTMLRMFADPKLKAFLVSR